MIGASVEVTTGAEDEADTIDDAKEELGVLVAAALVSIEEDGTLLEPP